MKLLVSTTTAVVLLYVVFTVFESEAAYRRNYANDFRRQNVLQLRRSASDIDFNEPQTQENSENEHPVYHHYSNIITGKLFLRVGQSMKYFITMIEHLRDLLVQYEWHTLAGAVDYWIQVLKKRLDYENSMAALFGDNSQERNQNRGHFNNYPCQPYDTRAGC